MGRPTRCADRPSQKDRTPRAASRSSSSPRFRRPRASDLNSSHRIVKLLVLVNSAPTFTEPHLVANGASELLNASVRRPRSRMRAPRSGWRNCPLGRVRRSRADRRGRVGTASGDRDADHWIRTDPLDIPAGIAYFNTAYNSPLLEQLTGRLSSRLRMRRVTRGSDRPQASSAKPTASVYWPRTCSAVMLMATRWCLPPLN